MKNGVERLVGISQTNVQTEKIDKRVPTSPLTTSKEIEDLIDEHDKTTNRISFSLIKTTFNDQGFYQCGVRLSAPLATDVLSEIANVQFTGKLHISKQNLSQRILKNRVLQILPSNLQSFFVKLYERMFEELQII